MEELKEEKALKAFSWKALFIVTSLCCFLFSGILWLLDGSSSGFFMKAGIVFLTIGVLIFILNKPVKRPANRKTGETS